MPFDSNGTYNRVRLWVSDAAAGVKIRADYHDAHDSDIATALSNVITKDGRTQPIANIPMNGRKIINHGSTVGSDAPNTVATKDYVDSFKSFAAGLTVSGANYPNGMLHFSSTTGITGLSWVNADMSWVGKVAVAGKYMQRLVVTNDAQGAGSEMVTIAKDGIIGFMGWLTHNLSHEGSPLVWRTNVKGTGSALTYTNGTMSLYSNDTATLQDNQTTTLQAFWTLGQTTMTHVSNSDAAWVMKKKASGQYCSIYGYTGAEIRWRMDLGNSSAESGTAFVGSNFALWAYDNAGANGKQMMIIDRSTDRVTFRGDVYSSAASFVSATTTAILASASANGAVYLRPNGPDSATEQVFVNSVGEFHISAGHLIVDANTTKGSYLGMGQRGRNGTTGNYTSNWHNWLYTSAELYALVDSTNIGMVSTPCDYRTKRNIQPLESTWDKVKKLVPISFNRRGFKDLFPDDEKTHWGFIAHDLQKTLTEDAATGVKDAPDQLQGPNMLAIVAALTKALQEAQLRIEALEGAPA